MGRKPNKLKFIVDAEGNDLIAKEPSSYIKQKIQYESLVKAYNDLKESKTNINPNNLEFDNLKSDFEKLKIKKSEIVEKIIEVPIKLNDNQFIIEITSDLLIKLNDCILYLEKEGSLKEIDKKDYLKVFTELSYKFIIKNYFSKL